MNKAPLLILGLALVALLFGAVGGALAVVLTAPAAAANVASISASSIGSSFTVQGRLEDGSSLADGLFDFQLRLYDSATGGAQVGGQVTIQDVTVSDGLFTVEPDFGAQFDGKALWLEVRVRPGTSTGAYTTLSPRHLITGTPYALGLQPGATIAGSVAGGVLNLSNSLGDGVQVGSVGGNGLSVDHADENGIFVCSTGFGTGCTPSGTNNGLEVASSDGNGVRVVSAELTGVVVDSAGTVGVSARTINHQFYGGQFFNDAASGIGAALYARGNSSTAADIILGANSSGAGDDGIIASDPNYSTSDIILESYDNVAIDLDQDANSGVSSLLIRDENLTTVYEVNENGDTFSTGTKSAVVDSGQHGRVKLYAIESPEIWFEDFGTAELAGGEALVAIEEVFAATVNLTEDYHVFLTPLGDCGLYVAAKMPSSFTVRALGAATCNITFDYRIVARRQGYENLRLEPMAATEHDD